MAFVLLTAQYQRTVVGRRGRVLWEPLPSVFQLVLVPASRLYPYSAGRVEWSGDELRLLSGVYAVASRYLVVDDRGGAFVTEAEAYLRLGAGTELSALGLGDAVISLAAGDLTNAGRETIAGRIVSLRPRGVGVF